MGKVFSRNEAAEKMASGLNCAQTVLSQFADDFGYDEEELQRISAPFGGGMRNGDTCGAFTGALMAIGLCFGGGADDEEAAEKTVEMTKEFRKRFVARFGASACRDLLGYDFAIEGQREAAEEAGVKQRCPDFVWGAIEIAEELMAEQNG